MTMLLEFVSKAMMILRIVIFIAAVVLTSAQTNNNYSFSQVFAKCKYGEKSFDTCIKNVLNDLRPFFKTGIPEYNIRPFDPHKADSVVKRGGDGLLKYQLVLRNVSEYGWTDSHVTNYRTDSPNNRIVYSQYFPEKNLDGFYQFTGSIAGNQINRKGIWNLTLSDYSQTTTVKRLGGKGSTLKVNVTVDRIGGMSLHISDFFGNRQILNAIADGLINNMWQLGLPFVTPLINDLVSTAFTDIFNDSFRNFPLDNFIH